ncbi:alanine racemase [Candidatus Magnetaquicoccus inordinatus]|uniref:alanine racemase n=1 Tax=Candidatus Magnetaquicoccus inordinatus TaxID=2496818 RepID=UPI00102AA536|nr:alanine racemase [Candidatus Magnetaquicoccus inordinatus]
MARIFHISGRPTWLEIDLDAIEHNFQHARNAVAPGVALYPVVKANGYGLGVLPIAKRLLACGAYGLCIATIEEAIQLRAAGISQPLILLSGLSADIAEQVAAYHLQPFVFDLSHIHPLSRAARHHPITFFLKVYTGMGRFGLLPEQLPEALQLIRTLPGLSLAGLVSHLACSDQPDHPDNSRQLHNLQQLLIQSGMSHGQTSLANSGAILSRPDTHFSWVRPGIMLYGASPFFPHNHGSQIGLKPVVSWYTRIQQIRSLPTGSGVGYGQTFVTQRPSRIAILPVGYADGYNRLLGNRAQVLLQGQRIPVVGRVSMDSIAIDTTELSEVAIGAPVTLLGRDQEEEITAEEMASWCSTIPYEIFTNLGERVAKYPVSSCCS